MIRSDAVSRNPEIPGPHRWHHEFKGLALRSVRWLRIGFLPRRVATIESIGSSTRIEEAGFRIAKSSACFQSANQVIRDPR